MQSSKKRPWKIKRAKNACLFNAAIGLFVVLAMQAVGMKSAQAQGFVEPDQVQFTLEGCRNNGNITLPIAGQFVCPTPDYTTGNLGKGWNELDLVPHRLTTSVGTQSSATTDYNVIIAADYQTNSLTGYDVISAPTVNAALSDPSCTVSAGPQSTEGSLTTPFGGVAGVDVIIYRTLTVHQNKGATCVFDYYERLALGSHLYPGSSLQSYMFESADFKKGKRTVSIPVNQILPQELEKDMTATQGGDVIWDVSKTSEPASVNFSNTCDPQEPKSKPVQVTVQLTRTETTSGEISIITHVYATNPASRAVDITLADVIYSGVTPLNTANVGPLTIPANSTTLVLTHTFTTPSGTDLNDIATATYIDTVTQVPIPGTVTATASAEVQTIESGDTAVLSDWEIISGAGLLFSVGNVGGTISGAFNPPYTLNTPTTGPVTWISDSQSASGSVAFAKTVYAPAQPAEVTGELQDTATIITNSGFIVDVTAHTDILISARVALTINKTITPPLASGTQTFTFVVKDAQAQEVATASITFNPSETSKSTVVTDLAPGSYTVSENPVPGWITPADKSVDIVLPSCQGSVSFTDTEQGHIIVKKVTNPSGDPTSFAFTTNYSADFSLVDQGTQDSGPLNPGGYSVTETVPSGWSLTNLQCVSEQGTSGVNISTPTAEIDLAPGDTVTCTYTDTQNPPENGRIIVRKIAEHCGPGTTFTFNTNYKGSFDLTNGQSDDSGALVPGNYTVTEVVPNDWKLDKLQCTSLHQTSVINVNAPTASIALAAGDTVTCTFTDKKIKPPHGGKIIVRKITKPCDGHTKFPFTTSDPNIRFSLEGGQSVESDPLRPGKYSVTEIVPHGWQLKELKCISKKGISRTTTYKPTATIDLVDDDVVTCTFVDVKKECDHGSVKVIKTVGKNRPGSPPSGRESFTFELRHGASSSAAGNILESEKADARNHGVIDFDTDLEARKAYQICERLVPGYQPVLEEDCTFFHPGGDPRVICMQFSVKACETKKFVVRNVPKRCQSAHDHDCVRP